jgi:phosphate uptake regulator
LAKEDTRKIQFTGKSSYIVSLPKDWVFDNGLKQGDRVSVLRQGNSGLEIKPNYSSTKNTQESATFEIKSSDEQSSVVRKLIALYFLRYKIIHIKPKDGRIIPSQRTAIRNSVKKILMGAEIIADSSEGITIQVMINLIELSIDGAFKRMMLLAKSMQNDALLAIKEGNVELAKEVIDSDDDVDRFGFYIIRQLTIAIENAFMLEEMGFRSSRECLGYRVIVKNIERLADHAVRIAKDCIDFEKPIKDKPFNAIQQMSDFSLDLIDKSTLALFKNDYSLAEETIQESEKIAEYEEKINSITKSLRSDEEFFRIRKISDNVKRIAEYASDIGEIVVNMNIEKVIKKTN